MTGPNTEVRSWKPPRSLPVRPTRILVAEDEHLVATELVLTLADLGYTVVGPAPDGMSAITLAHKAMPELALVDIRMPRKDGLATSEQLFRELAIPTVILSAYADQEYVDAARKSGVYGYLVKPASESQLRAGLELAWQRYCDHMEALAESDELRRRLEERRVIEQAKWKLVSEQKLTEPDALKLLQKLARDKREHLVQVAQRMIDGTAAAQGADGRGH